MEPVLLTEVVLLILGGGFRFAAWKLAQDNSNLQQELKDSIKVPNGVTDDLIDRETAYMVGLSTAGLFVMLFYLTCFKRKHYLLLVCINSIMVIANVVICTLYILDIEHHDTKGIIHDLIYKETLTRSFILGILDSASMFILVNLVPSIIAVKQRTSKGVFMAGTVIGTVLSFMYVTSSLILSTIHLSQTNKEINENQIRYLQASFCIISNLFFIVRAVEDYEDLRQNDELNIRRICCWNNRSKDGMRMSSLESSQILFPSS